MRADCAEWAILHTGSRPEGLCKLKAHCVIFSLQLITKNISLLIWYAPLKHGKLIKPIKWDIPY